MERRAHEARQDSKAHMAPLVSMERLVHKGSTAQLVLRVRADQPAPLERRASQASDRGSNRS